MRLAALQAELGEQMRRFNQGCVGRTFDVLLEKPGRYDGQMIGRSPYLQSVNLMAPSARIGDMVQVKIVGVLPNSLKAELTETVENMQASLL